MEINGSVFEEKSSFKMLWLSFSFELDCDSCVVFVAKTGSKKIGALICSIKLLSSTCFSVSL